MAANNNKKETSNSITGIRVGGYKSLVKPQTVALRPLTVLAGANSSGKSSLMQAVLLIKQTVEASYDPGPLLLDGPHVRFSEFNQLFSRGPRIDSTDFCEIAVTLEDQSVSGTKLAIGDSGGIKVASTFVSDEENGVVEVRAEMTKTQLQAIVPQNLAKMLESFDKDWRRNFKIEVSRSKCFLGVELFLSDNPLVGFDPGRALNDSVRRLVHLPGLRGNPLRAYPLTGVSLTFPGTFQNYVASIVLRWQETDDTVQLHSLFQDLRRLGLTWKVVAQRQSDTHISLSVGRLPAPMRGGARDLVNLADVGFGLSQVLPVIVALHAAKPDQLVYVEQPELHLHPRAQSALADVFASAVSRGVRLVVETHSALLLLGVQRLVAAGKLDPSLVQLRRP